MRKQLPLLLLLLLPLMAWAQTVTVPKNVYFADVHLRISDGAQQEIQKKVDALHRNQTYFKIKVDLANSYFPIIERVFKQEGVPDDFKYLALQESGLIGDAVSTSNAVGYWQFKKEAAMDFNLRMDNIVDERRHIIEASRGAAKYFKRSNQNYDNWFTSLLSYYLGYTGVKTYSSPSDKGSKKLDVTEKSHPYVITFLAHKIAYDNFIGREKPAVALREMRATPGQSLSDIALATKTDFAELEKYNKWLLGNSIPSDKDYYVMVPVRNDGSNDTGLLASSKEETPAPVVKTAPSTTNPRTTKQSATAAAKVVKRNGLNAIVARPDDTKDKLALQAGISTRKFLKYNDLHNFDEIVAGTAYYIEQKSMNADAEYHTVQPGETMQQISQHYGIRLNYLRYKNRMGRNEVPVPGRVLWLQKRRPSAVAVEVKDTNPKQSIAATQAAPSYSKPQGTAIKETAATATNEAPKENVFKRFFNSLKKNKEVAADKETTVVEAPKVTSASEAPAVAATSPVKEEEEIEEEVEEILVEEVVIEEAPKQTPALYPGKSGLEVKPKAEAQPASQPAKTEVKPATKPVEKTVIAKAEDNKVLYPATEKPATKPAAPAANEAAPATKPATKPEAVKPQEQTQEQVEVKAATHVVAKGETLYGISKQYSVTVAELTAWNKLNDTALKLGQELIIVEPLNFKAEPVAETKAPVHKAAVATESQPVNATPAATSHTVEKGETLYQISKSANVSIDDLRKWNNLSDSNIKPGQVLKLVASEETEVEEAPVKEVKKESASAASGNVYHTVVSGESMYQISRKYGVTIKDIMEWNKKSDFNVAPGEKLLIKKN